MRARLYARQSDRYADLAVRVTESAARLTTPAARADRVQLGCALYDVACDLRARSRSPLALLSEWADTRLFAAEAR